MCLTKVSIENMRAEQVVVLKGSNGFLENSLNGSIQAPDPPIRKRVTLKGFCLFLWIPSNSILFMNVLLTPKFVCAFLMEHISTFSNHVNLWGILDL